MPMCVVKALSCVGRLHGCDLVSCNAHASRLRLHLILPGKLRSIGDWEKKEIALIHKRRHRA